MWVLVSDFDVFMVFMEIIPDARSFIFQSLQWLNCSLGGDNELQLQPGFDIGDLSTHPAHGK